MTVSGSSAKDTSGCGAEDDAGGVRVSLTSIRPGETDPMEGSVHGRGQLVGPEWLA
jgi:hypothetical protein